MTQTFIIKGKDAPQAADTQVPETTTAPPVEATEPVIKPRMSARETDLFKRHITRSGTYLEFGCGGSTMLALDSPLRQITSVESDLGWVKKLRETTKIADAEKSGRLRFRTIDVGPIGEWGYPQGDTKIRNWPAYYGDIWKSSDSLFDVVLIDGRFRTACALLTAMFAPETTTVMIHDYSHRPDYYAIERYFDTIETADTLVVLRRRPQFNMRAWSLDLMANLFNPS